MTMRVPNLKRSLRIVAALLGTSAALGACTHTDQDTPTGSIPVDYRQRHPIVVQEANRATEIFVGTGRGGLTAAQRSDIAGLGETWLRESTGGIVIDMPVNTPNARVAADSLREIRAILAAVGVPPRGITVRNYRPTDPRLFATIRVNYPRITADAGPCGVWPEDLGPSIKNKSYLENRPYYNLGCASQRNLAAMVANPSDLVQPRSEAPVYTGRRTIVLDKYRKGESTATVYADPDKNKVSNVGQ
jgi:pilus assembly protein CpaD